MKRFLVLALVLIPTASLAFQNEQDGFRGIPWGTSRAATEGMFPVKSIDPQNTVCQRKGDGLKIGAAELESISYMYWEDQLWAVFIRSSGYQNSTRLKEALSAQFGPGKQTNPLIERYIWLGAVTNIVYTWNPYSKDATLTFFSVQIGAERKAGREKDALDAAKDF